MQFYSFLFHFFFKSNYCEILIKRQFFSFNLFSVKLLLFLYAIFYFFTYLFFSPDYNNNNNSNEASIIIIIIQLINNYPINNF